MHIFLRTPCQKSLLEYFDKTKRGRETIIISTSMIHSKSHVKKHAGNTSICLTNKHALCLVSLVLTKYGKIDMSNLTIFEACLNIWLSISSPKDFFNLNMT